jgi:hypothetical protein
VSRRQVLGAEARIEQQGADRGVGAHHLAAVALT